MTAIILALGVALGGVNGGYGEPPLPKSSAVGLATWYRASYCRRQPCVINYAAAGPALRKLVPVKWHMAPRKILVGYKGKWVEAYVVDWCACNGSRKPGDERLVDLSPAVWGELGVRLSKGVIKVEIRVP